MFNICLRRIKHFFSGDEPLKDLELLETAIEPFMIQGYADEELLMKTIVKKWKEEYTESNESCQFYYLVKALIKAQDYIDGDYVQSIVKSAVEDLKTEQDKCIKQA